MGNRLSTSATTRAVATIGSGAAVEVLAANPARVAVRIYNSSGVTIYVACGTTATSSLGETVVNGGFWSTEAYAASSISVIAASGSNLTIQVTP